MGGERCDQRITWSRVRFFAAAQNDRVANQNDKVAKDAIRELLG